MDYPRVAKKVTAINVFDAPNLSIMTPPSKGQNKLGNEYILYSKLYCVLSTLKLSIIEV